jgi:pimeloyl-ACP methyl ester carboxylesterase
MKKRAFLLLCLAYAAAGAARAQDLVLTEGTRLVGKSEEGGVIVWDVAWNSGVAAWRESSAWIVVGKGSSARAAILYAHMFGQGKNRNQFLPEAKENARSGIASILVSGAVPWKASWRGMAEDRDLLEMQLRDTLRGLALLKAQSWVDPARIAYVGHDYGAMAGASLAARGSGFRAYALLAPIPRYGGWISYFYPRLGQGLEYDAYFGDEQPLAAVARAGDLPVLLQFAERDRYVSDASVQAFRDGAPKAQILIVADADHDSIAELGRESRMRFLMKYLAPVE